MAEITVRDSESSHWYTREGQPKYTVEAKNGNLRNTTLRDARKLGLLPSVTTIIKCAASPGLEAWKLNQMMLAALTLPRAPEESEESFIYRVQADSKEHARMAAERGTQVHADIEGYFEGASKEPSAYSLAVDRALAERFGDLDWSAEKSFATPGPHGFGGKIDLHSTAGDGVVIDFKTKEFTSDTLDKAAGYDEHMMQLAAYRMGLNLPKARAANVFVSVTEPGLVVVNEWSQEDLARGWGMFEALKTYWYIKTNL